MTEQLLGEFLVKQGLLNRDDLRRVLEAQKAFDCRLGTVVLDLGLMSEQALLRAIGRYCSARTVGARELTGVPPEVVAMVPRRFALRHQLMPFRHSGKTLSVATIDPRNLLVDDELGLMTGCMIASYVAVEVRIEEALARYHGKQLPVQMVSLLKRLRGDEAGAAAGVPAVPAGAAAGGGEKPPRPMPGPGAGYRPGLATRRQPDDTAMVVLSDDELADFPSLRKSLEDTDAGGTRPPAAVTEPAPAAESGEVTADLPVTPADSAEPAASKQASEPEASTQPCAAPGDSVEARLEATARALLEAEMREDIADAVFAFCAPYLRRRLLLAVREGIIIGWRGEGDGIDPLWVRSMSIPLKEPSVFRQISGGGDLWLGPLPPLGGHQDLLLGLGGEEPAACLVLPVVVRSRVVAYLYGDNLDDDLETLPVGALRRLVAKTGLALEVTMLRNKILTL